MARMGRSCRSGSGWIFGLLLLLISTSVGQNTTRAKEYQPEGCLRCIVFTWPCKCKAWFARGRWGNGSINLVIIRCGQPCLQAAENTLLPCITAAVGEAMTCELKMILPSHQTMYWFNTPKYADQIQLSEVGQDRSWPKSRLANTHLAYSKLAHIKFGHTIFGNI